MKKTNLTFKIAALFFVSGLAMISFQNCGDMKVSKADLASVSATGSTTVSYLVPATSMYSFSSNPNLKQLNPIQQYELGDGIINASAVNSVTAPSKIKTLATAPGIVKWPNGEIPFFFDPNSGFTATEISTLRTNMLAACSRWTALAGVKCTELTSGSPVLAANSVLPYLVVTQSNVPLPWVLNPTGFCSSGSSCATIGYAGNNGVSHYAIHKSFIGNMWNLTHELGHVLGLFHEHQRPGRDSFISVRNDKISDGNFAIISSLNSVNSDYDYASVMHYPTVGGRNADYLANAGSTYLAFRTGQQFQSFTHMHRSALNFGAGSRGLAVNLAGYPSVQDSVNARALYGAPAVSNQQCQLSGGQSAIPHGTRIGIFTSQSPATTTNGFCDVEPRLCVNGSLTGGDGLEHFRVCDARCNIVGVPYDYGARFTYYKISSGTQAQCDANRVEGFCDTTLMLAPVTGSATCTVSVVTPTSCPLPLQKTLTSAANNLGATNTCVFNLTSVNPGSTSSVTSSVAGSSYALACQANSQWATSPTSSVCPAPAAGILTCPSIQKTVTSAANNAGATNSCVFNLSSTNVNTIGNAFSSIAGSSYALSCQSNAQWATTATSSICPAPANAILSCPAVQKTVLSAANNVGATNSCVFNLTATTGGLTHNAVSSVAGSSYSLMCQTNGQWATTPTTSVCPTPAPGTVVCAPMQRSVVSAANTAGATNTCTFELVQTAAGTSATVSSSIAGSSYTVACQSTGQWATSPTASICPAPAETAANSCKSQAVPLLCSINGSTKTITAQLNLTGAPGTVTAEMTNQSNMSSLDFSNPAIDFSKSYGFKLQWFCNSNFQWQFSHPSGNCNFQSVYNPTNGATCDRYYYSMNECTCRDTIGGTKVFPFVGEVSHEECSGGESGGCYTVIDTPGTCDGKLPNYVPPPETGGGY